MTPDRLLRWLLSFPFPGALAAMQGDELTITLEGEVLRFDGAWRAPDGQRIPCTLPGDCDAGDVHAEISRGLAITRGITGASWYNVTPEPAPSWEDIKADCVGPDLPGDDTLKTAHAALTRICDVIGAPIPGCPDDVVEAVAKLIDVVVVAERRAKTAEQALKDINLALLDAGAPRAYTLDKGERPIPDADRVRLLGDRVRGEWRERARVEADHSERGQAVNDAHLALDDRKAPRLADGCVLSLAARIRAIPR